MISVAVEQQCEQRSKRHAENAANAASGRQPSALAGLVATPMRKAKADDDAEVAAAKFGEVVLITKQRQFASYFIDLVAATTDNQFNLLLFIATLLVAGKQVIDGHLSLGGFSIIMSASSDLQVAGGARARHAAEAAAKPRRRPPPSRSVLDQRRLPRCPQAQLRPMGLLLHVRFCLCAAGGRGGDGIAARPAAARVRSDKDPRGGHQR